MSFAERAPRKVFLVGATGGVGKLLIGKLRADGHTVTGLHRKPDDADALRAAGAEPVRGDIAAASVDDFAEWVAGHDAVVFTAGAGGGPHVDAIDGAGPGKVARAAVQAGVDRFLLVSVFMDAWRGDATPGEDFEHYMAAKRHADVELAATDLNYLIVRPGTLSDADGTGSVHAGIAVPYDDIPRADVAGFIAAAVFAPDLSRLAVEITRGDRPISQAVRDLRPRTM